MAERFFPDFEFDPDRSFTHIQDTRQVHAEVVVVEGAAKDANDTLDGWAYDAGRTVIDGGEIQTGTVTAQKLSALTIEVGKYIRSSGYSAGSSGWKIDGNGDAEFNDVTVRGTVESSTVTSSSFYTWSGGTGTSGVSVSASSGIGGPGVEFYNSNSTGRPSIYSAGTGSKVSLLLTSGNLSGTKGSGDGTVELSNTSGGTSRVEFFVDQIAWPSGIQFGAFGASPVTKRTVTGSRGGINALANLLSALETYGLITDNSSS